MQGIQASLSRLVPLCMVRRSAMLQRRPLHAAMGFGACVGLLGVVCGLVVAHAVLHFLPPEYWGKSGAAHLDELGPAMMFFLMAVFAPVVETVLGQVLPMEAARRLGAGPGIQVVLSGLVWGGGHYASGGLAHGITAIFAGPIFACAYAVLRPAGVRPAFIAAATAHAMQNGIMWAFMILSAVA